MRLNIDVDLDCTLTTSDAALLMVVVASGDDQIVVTSELDVGQATLRRLGETAMMWVIPTANDLTLRYRATVEITRNKTALAELQATPLHLLPAEVLPFLRPSRYCQSDQFIDFASQRFGTLTGGAKIAAIRDWIASQLTYVSGSSHGGTTAVETFASLNGVCRDYAHLFCALARAAQIPARYVSVYGADVTPQDFHAVAQVWLQGAWHIVDATGMGAPHELAVIATGRDAADCAFMETGNWAQIDRQDVRVTKV